MNIIEVKKLNFKYKERIIFENLTFNIRKNVFITILGENGCGQSTLANLIMSGYNGINIKEKSRCLISYNPNDYIVGKTVKEQLIFHMKEQYIKKEEIERRLEKIIKEFNLFNNLDKDPFNLSNEDKQMIVILSYLIANFKVIIFDNATCYLKSKNKDKIFKYLKSKKRTIVNITSDSEECLYGEYIGIIENKGIILKKKEDMLKCEKIFLNNNIKIPFMVELSLKLQYYNLTSEIFTNMNEMVDQLWK